jgi:ribosomal protein L11 methyltransferase
MNYIEVSFELSPKTPWSDILTAYLAELGFESFVDADAGFQAYIQEDLFDAEALKSLDVIANPPEELTLNYSVKIIEAQNWNATWESSFEPVIIDDDLAIVAPFHADFPQTKYTIVIEPKMSFGTGHHQTTRLMSKALFHLESIPERVLDMGCGTGVLAILAEKLGAKSLLAVDVEQWAFENTIENAERNACQNIKAEHGDVKNIIDQEFDLILANINKNVLKADMNHYAACLPSGGRLFLSGFFTSDNNELLDVAKKCNLALDKTYQEENWSCLTLVKA